VYTNVYNPSGANVGIDPDGNVRFELNRDWARGKYERECGPASWPASYVCRA
jgi:hypothetical protein